MDPIHHHTALTLFLPLVSTVMASLETLRGFGDLARKDKRHLKTTLPSLWELFKRQEMVPLAKLCMNCVNGDSAARFSMHKVVKGLENFADGVEFHWRHGTSIVYHTIEPGDDLVLSSCGEDRMIGQLGRLPRREGATPLQNPIEDHIRHGSRFDYRSPCISCSLNFPYCVFYAQKQNNMFSEYGLAPILKIDLSKLQPKDRKGHVMDRTRRAVRPSENVLSRNFTSDADEVILDMPIPGAAIRRVYNLDHTLQRGESPAQHKTRVGVLKEVNKLNSSANERGDRFGTWENQYRQKFMRMADNEGGDPDSVRDKARCRDPEATRCFLTKYCPRGQRPPLSGVRLGGSRGANAQEQRAERQWPRQIGTQPLHKKYRK